MKKIQFMSLMALMLLVSNTVMAQQDSKSEISFSIGEGTPNEKGIGEALGEGFAKAIVSAMTGGLYNPNQTRKEESNSLAFNLQYLYRVAPKIKVGGAVSYQHTSATLMVADQSGAYHDAAKSSNDYFTVMPVFKAMWIEKKHIGLYSKAAAGICIASNSAKTCSGFQEGEKYIDDVKSDKGTRFAYQVSAIGFEAGSKNIRGFVELGYGFQGFAQVGVCVKL